MAERIIRDCGFDVIVFDGELRRNSKGVSSISTEGVTMRIPGNLTIFVSANMSVDGLEAAYHEVFHATKDTPWYQYHLAMCDVISENIDTENEAFEKFVNEVADMYCHVEKKVPQDAFDEEVIEEFFAWYVGKLYSSDGGDMWDFIEAFSDVAAVKAKLDEIYAQLPNIKSEKSR